MTVRSMVDITPDTNLVESFQAQHWSVAQAIAEAVDNSFGKGRGDATRVYIVWDPTQRHLTILDNGRGMDDVRLLFQLGKGAVRSVKDIGKYGYGGTSMCLWLGSYVEVWTLRDGRVSSAIADWAKLRTSGVWEVPASAWARATPGNTPSPLFDGGSGTFIVLKVPSSRSFDVQRVKEELARTYAPGLRMGRRIVWETWRKNRTEREELSPAAGQPTDFQRFGITVRRHGRSSLYAEGSVWFDPEATTEESQIAIAYGPRVIKRTRDCYNAPDGSERFSGVGVVGFLDLGEGWQDELTVTKIDFRDDRVWDVMMATLFDHLRPMLAAAQDKAEQVQLADLALNLAVGLDGVFDVEVEVSAGPQTPEPQYTWTKSGAASPGVPPIVAKREPVVGTKGEGATTTETQKAAARVWVEFQPSSRLSGFLYDIAVSGDDITVYLNRDHEDVRHARERKTPTQQRMLYALIVPAISILLLEDDNLRKRALSGSVRRRLDGLDSKTLQMAFLNGLLLNGAKAVAAAARA